MYLVNHLTLVVLFAVCHITAALPVSDPIKRQYHHSFTTPATWSTYQTIAPTPTWTPPTTTPTSTSVIPSSTAVPVLPVNFPDPSFLQTKDGYFAFATSDRGFHIQIAYSHSFDNPSWTLINQDALPNPGPWTDNSFNTWAPYVFQADNGNFVLYYSAPPSSNPDKHCIGTATSRFITGPYIPSPAPFVCPLDQGGAIDPSAFKDPATGNLYIMYKIDGNSLDSDQTNYHPTPIKIQQVNPLDGITPIGSPDPATAPTLIDRDDTDGPLVEAPTMFFQDGTYYLLYSTHLFNGLEYDLRFATASSVTGPFVPHDTSPVLSTTTGGQGLTSPGSADVDPQGGNTVFHATVGFDANNSPVRDMYAGTVSVRNGIVVFDRLV